jgi:predicted patatin/cPLA2 family phospholipase
MLRVPSAPGCFNIVFSVVLATCLSACNTDSEWLNRIPEPLVSHVTVGEFQNIRFDADNPASLHALAEERIHEIREAYGDKSLKGRKVDINYLSLSGGGGDGAFGAGVLVGWSESGKRPKFDVVTGISTGTLIAPMAFLGAEYDEKMREAYTTISAADVEEHQELAALLGATDSLSAGAPLQKLIARYVTQQMLDEIAVQHRKGRALLNGTTNLDAQRPVIWDIGSIAESGLPDALALTRQIIRASASIPGEFPPVKIAVNAAGKPYHEIHVDGGVTRQVFLFPPGMSSGLDAEAAEKPEGRPVSE